MRAVLATIADLALIAASILLGALLALATLALLLP